MVKNIAVKMKSMFNLQINISYLRTVLLDINLTLASTYLQAPTPFFEQSMGAREQVQHAIVRDLHMTLVRIYARKR